MKVKFAVFVYLGLIACASADEASHRRATTEFVSLADPKGPMRAGFLRSIEGGFTKMKAGGASDAMIAELKQAMEEWYDTEVKYEDVQVKVVALYMKAFSEAEINQLIDFYKSPLGQKLQANQPAILEESKKIGREYAESKQGPLREKIEAIRKKYGK